MNCRWSERNGRGEGWGGITRLGSTILFRHLGFNIRNTEVILNNSRHSKLTHPCVPRGICVPCIVLLLALALPATLQAQFEFTTDNGTITITKYTGYGGAVTIPASINGLPVTRIGDGAFWCGLTAVIFQGSAPALGQNVFRSGAGALKLSPLGRQRTPL